MTTTLLLPWFPIILAVGVGGHLLGQRRGLVMGFCCALFWTVLAQAAAGPALWSDGWVVLSLFAGSAAIIGMGAWAGQHGAQAMTPEREGGHNAASITECKPETAAPIIEIGSLIDLFDDWLIEHSARGNPWPAFAEFIRSALYRSCGATHVRPYRLADGGEELIPLRESDPLLQGERLPARRGVVGHVVTSGRSYVATDAGHGPLVDEMAAHADRECAWCFAINRGTFRLGVVSVGHLESDPQRLRPLLLAVERLVGQFWRTLDATVRCHSAEETDPVSGLPTRPAFLDAAEHGIHESYQQGEPVALALFAIEGIRDLADNGRWKVADELVAEVARTLLRKVRSDDRVGRFDGSRFLVLLRRVDSELATLIIEQLTVQLESVCQDHSRWGTVMNVRCGLVGSGTQKPDVKTLMERALAQDRRARTHDMRTATDLAKEPLTVSPMS